MNSEDHITKFHNCKFSDNCCPFKFTLVDENADQLKLDYVFSCDICNTFSKTSDLKHEKFTVMYGNYMISHWFDACRRCISIKRNFIITLGDDYKIKSISNLGVDFDSFDRLIEAEDIDGMIGFIIDTFAK